jgi:hypothetical protein
MLAIFGGVLSLHAQHRFRTGESLRETQSAAPSSRFQFSPATLPGLDGSSGIIPGKFRLPVSSRFHFDSALADSVKFNPFVKARGNASPLLPSAPDDGKSLGFGLDALSHLDEQSHAGWEIPGLTNLLGVRASYRGMSTNSTDGSDKNKPSGGLYLRF